MKKQTKVITILIVVAILLMGIGYAALSSTTLKITGNASAVASDENFKVYFTGANTVKNPNTDDVTVSASNGADEASVTITGLTKAEDSAYAILEIENGSNGIDASSVNVTASTTDTNYFDIEAVMCDNSGAPISNYEVLSGNKTYVKVSARLKVTPTENVDTGISVTITAIPAEN